MAHIRFRTLGVTLGAAMAAMVAMAGPAGAEESSTTAVISAGSDKVAIGSAEFTRTTTSDGGETLTVTYSVADGIDESSVCLSDEPFTSRLAPGGCTYKQGATGSTAEYVIDLGTAYLGQPVYVQAHVVSGDDTAFAGWQDGNPFYGNVEVAAAAGTEVPLGAVGGLGLALLAAGALAAATLRRRAVRASS